MLEDMSSTMLRSAVCELQVGSLLERLAEAILSSGFPRRAVTSLHGGSLLVPRILRLYPEISATDHSRTRPLPHSTSFGRHRPLSF